MAFLLCIEVGLAFWKIQTQAWDTNVKNVFVLCNNLDPFLYWVIYWSNCNVFKLYWKTAC